MNLTLPFPPSVNGYWRTPNKGSSRGRTLVSERGRAFQAEAIAQVMEQLRRRPKPISADISVAVVFYPPTKARRDLDNFFKAMFDAMTQAVCGSMTARLSISMPSGGQSSRAARLNYRSAR